MKKIIVGISLITFVLFVYTANANNVRQDKSKSVVTVTGKTTTDGHKCCAGDKKTDAKCCAGDKKTDAKSCKGEVKKEAAKKDAKCEPKAGCSKKCTSAK